MQRVAQKAFLFCLIGVLDPKTKTAFYKFTPFNYIFFCVYSASGCRIQDQTVRGRFFKDYEFVQKISMRVIKTKLYLAIIILRDYYNSAMDKMNRCGGNKTRRLHKYFLNYALLSPMNVIFYREGKIQNPLSSPTMMDTVVQKIQ